MFDLNKKKKKQFLFISFGLQMVSMPWKKLKTSYYHKKISGNSWVSL